MCEKEIQESSKVFALSMVLLNILILVGIGGVFWLVQTFLMQVNQLNSMLSGIRV